MSLASPKHGKDFFFFKKKMGKKVGQWWGRQRKSKTKKRETDLIIKVFYVF